MTITPAVTAPQRETRRLSQVVYRLPLPGPGGTPGSMSGSYSESSGASRRSAASVESNARQRPPAIVDAPMARSTIPIWVRYVFTGGTAPKPLTDRSDTGGLLNAIRSAPSNISVFTRRGWDFPDNTDGKTSAARATDRLAILRFFTSNYDPVRDESLRRRRSHLARTSSSAESACAPGLADATREAIAPKWRVGG